MKTLHLLFITLLSLLLLGATAWGQSTDDYRSATSGNWNVNGTWERFDGTSWVAATGTPTSTNNAITIRNGHTVTVTVTVASVDQVTVDVGGQVTINSGIGWTLANGTGTDLTINGTVLNSGLTLFGSAGPTWVVNAGGTYIHNTTGGIATPLSGATLDSLSNFIYRGSSSLSPAVSLANRTYGNLTFESTSGVLVKGSLTGSTPFVVKGNYDIGGSGAGTVLVGQAGGTGTTTVYGNLTIRTNCSDTISTGTFTINGNITNNGGFVTNSTASVIFNGNTTISGNVVAFASGFTVNANKTLANSTNGNILAASKTATINGTFQINEGSWTGSNGTFSYGSSGTLVFNNSSGNYGPIDNSHLYWPSSSGPVNVTVQNSGGINLSVARTVTGTFKTYRQTNGAGNLTLNGTAEIDTLGYFTGSPTYGSSSTLKYNVGAVYGRGSEWNASSGAGSPASVQISNNTTLNYPAGTNSNMTITGNLTIDAGSSLYMDYGAPSWSKSLTVNGNVVLNGNLSLGDAVGGDLNVGGTWTYSPGNFSPNQRAVTFNGTGTQSITGATTFDYLTVNKSSGTMAINNNVTMNKLMTVTGVAVTTGANKVVITSTGSLSEAGSGKIILGNVEATRTISATGNETFGGIGFEMNPASSPYPGATTITRVTGTAKVGGGNSSIKRYYDVSAGTSSGLNLSLVFHYDDAAAEIGTQSEGTFSLYRSATGSDPWTLVTPSSASTSLNTLTATGVTNLSTWTASDASNPMVTSASANSDVVSAGGESVTISSIINDASPLTSSTGVQVWQVTVRDGGGSADADALPTQLTALTISQGTGNSVSTWSNAILAADLFDGTTQLASGTVGASTITFSSLSGVQASDGSSKTLSLRISLKNPLGSGVLDNQKFVFAVTSANVTAGSGATSSQFASFATTNSDNTKNAIAVVASKLVFTTQPSTTGFNGTALNQQPVAKAEDVNGNVDLDYANTVTLTNSGSFTMSGNAVAASSGVVTYSTLAINGTGSVTLSTTNGDGLTNATSNSIALSEAEPTTQATALMFSNITTGSAKLTWTNGNGARHLVIGRSGSAVSTNPTDAVSYTGNSVFGSGTAIGSGFAVYANTGDTVTVTGLTSGTTYFFAVYDYNGTGGLENYLVTSPATGSVTPGFVQSAQTGNWSATSTWVGGVVPTSSDDVIIGSNNTVTVDNAAAVCKNMTFFSSTTSKISFASASVLGVYGDFTLKATTQNAIGTWAAGAKLKFTGPAASQKLTGWNTGSTMATSFMEMVVDKSAGQVITDNTNEKLNIGTSLEIVNGAFVVDVTDDINGRTLDGTSSTPTITVQSGGTFSVRAGATQIQSGTAAGTPIGKVTVYGSVDLSTTSTNKINFGGVDIENGGFFNLNTGGSAGNFNPGTITIKAGGVLFNETTTNIWAAGSVVEIQTGGTYKTTTSTTPFPPTVNNNGTVRYQRTASGDQTITDMNYHRLEISFSGNNKIWTLSATRTIADSLEVNNSANLVLSAATAQTLNQQGTVRLTSGSIDNSDADVAFTLANGVTISRATGQISNAPVFGTSVNLRYTSVTGSVTSGPELPTSSTVLNNLSFTNTGQRVTLGANATVNGALSLSSGLVLTGTNTLALSSTGTTSRTSGWVVGNLKKAVGTGATTRTFEIGDTAKYTPIDIAFGNVSGAGDLTASTTIGDHSAIGTSGLQSSKSVNRFYTVANSGVTFDNYSANFTFDSADVDAGANTDNFVVRKYNGSSWSPSATGTRTATSTQATGLTSFSDFAIGEPTTHTITASAVGSGSITPSGSVSVNDASDQHFTVTPNAHYHTDSIVVNGSNMGVDTGYTFTNVTSDQSITAYFSIDRYTITVVQGSNGVIAPGTTQVDYNGSQAFTITPNAGYHVDSVMVDGAKVPDSLYHYTFNNVTTAHSITAGFSINTFTLNTTATHGSVTKDPNQANYDSNSTVQLTATADGGYHFVNWSGDASGSTNPLSVVMNGNKNITASFALNTFTLNITASNGSVTINPDQANYDSNSTVELTAVPATGYHFVNWSGDASGSTNPLSIVMNANKNITANFTINSYALTTNMVGNGSVTKNPDQATYTHGSTVELTATPDPGWYFEGWTGDTTDSHNPITLTMNSAKTVTATFINVPVYTINTTSSSGGSITPSGSVNVAEGNNAGFAYSPSTGYHIDSVLIDNVNILPDSSTHYTFNNVMANHSIRVVFAINVYTITVTQTANGTITPGTTTANYGSNKQFAIVASSGYHVDSVFADGAYVHDSTTSFTFNSISANHSLTAKYAINKYTLNTTAVNGSVSKNPNQSSYDSNSTVQLTATPASGYHFVNWSGDASGSTNPLSVVMNGNKNITANFAINTYNINITATNGSVSKNPNQANYDSNTTVQLTATPATGYHFVNWSGDASGSTNPLSVVMNGNKNITANFAINTYTLLTAAVNGSVAKNPDQVSYDSNSTVQLTATPASGYHFVNWSGDASGTDNPLTVVMNSDKHDTANFALDAFALNVSIIGSGTVSKNPDQSLYDAGSNVELTATPDHGWAFSAWSGDATGSVNPLSVTMDAAKNITATFTQDSAYLQSFRSFRPDSIYLDVDNAGKHGKSVKAKADKVEFSFKVKPDSNNVNDLHLEFGSSIDTSLDFTITPTPDSMNPVNKSSLKKWNIKFSASLNNTDSVIVSGWAKKGSFQKVSSYWWTRNGVTIGKKLKNPTFAKNALRLPMANRLNVMEETYKQGLVGGVVPITVGVARTDSSKKYAWVLLKSASDMFKSFGVTGKSGINLHDSSARGFDRLSNGKALLGKQTSLPPTKQDNILFANLAALKLSIAASALQKTPNGFGEIRYDDTASNPYNGMMLKEIAKKADTLMTGGPGRVFSDSATYATLNWTIARVLNAFEGKMDTLQFVGKLKATGTHQLIEYSFLTWDTTVVTSKVIPMEVSNVVPEQYSLQQNYPNPFNPATTISFDLPEAAMVTLKIYNILGQEVATIFEHEQFDEGTQEVEFNANSIASGVYLYKITAVSTAENGITKSFTSVKKMLLVK